MAKKNKSESKYTCEFAVEGMHCAACEITIEKKLAKFKGVKKVDAQLNKNKVVLELAKNVNPEDVREDLSKLIEPAGYRLMAADSLQVSKDFITKFDQKTRKEFGLALIITSALVLLFILLQKSGVTETNFNEINYPAVFIIGVVASLSTCMAVVGGIVLSLSSGLAKAKKLGALTAFHASRLVSFFALGGIIGILGQAFTLTPAVSFIMNSILFIVMVLLGLNLLNIFPALNRFQPRMPKYFGKKAIDEFENRNTVISAIALGAVTFFLPCGFTQSMQLYSLSTGNFLNGALTMLVFALGTFPILALISFASVKLSKSFQSGIFYKTAGLLILAFAIFNMINALVVIGAITPIFIF